MTTKKKQPKKETLSHFRINFANGSVFYLSETRDLLICIHKHHVEHLNEDENEEIVNCYLCNLEHDRKSSIYEITELVDDNNGNEWEFPFSADKLKHNDNSKWEWKIDWNAEHVLHKEQGTLIDDCPFCREVIRVEQERVAEELKLKVWYNKWRQDPTWRAITQNLCNAFAVMDEWAQPFHPLIRKSPIPWRHPGDPNNGD